MSLALSSYSNQQLQALLRASEDLLRNNHNGAHDDCFSLEEQTYLVSSACQTIRQIDEILVNRAEETAARVLSSGAAQLAKSIASAATSTRATSVSPFLPSPRKPSSSIESDVRTQSASISRFGADSGGSSLSSPGRTTGGAALSVIDEAAPFRNAVLVPADHLGTPTAGAGYSMLRSFAASGGLAPAPTTPLSVVPVHSAFARTFSSSTTYSPLPRAPVDSEISRLKTHGEDLDSRRDIDLSTVMPDMGAPPHEICDLGVYSDGEIDGTPPKDQGGFVTPKRYDLPPGVSLLNPPADPGMDPLFSVFFRSSVTDQRKASNE